MSTNDDMLLTLGLDKASIQKLKRDFQKVLKDTEKTVERVSKKETSSSSKRLSLLRAELAHQKALNKAKIAGVSQSGIDKATSEFKGSDLNSIRARTALINDLSVKKNELLQTANTKLREREAIEKKWVNLKKKAHTNITKMDAKSKAEANKAERVRIASAKSQEAIEQKWANLKKKAYNNITKMDAKSKATAARSERLRLASDKVEANKAERIKLALLKERVRQEDKVHAEALRARTRREADANRKKWTQSRLLGTMAIGGMAAGAVGGTVGHIASINSQFQSLEASFGGMFGADKAAEIRYVNQTANKFGNDLFDLAGSYMNLKAATDGVKMSQGDLRGLFEGFQKVAAISGSSNEEMRLSLRGLVQSLGAGKLQMQEFYQMVESIPLLRGVLEETLGNPKDINKLIGSGKVITKEILPELIKNLNKKFSDNEISKALNTIGRNATRFVNLWRTSMKALGEGGFNEAITESMSDMSKLLEDNQSMFSALGKVLGGVVTIITKLATLYGDKFANAIEMVSIIINQASEGYTELAKVLGFVGDESGATAGGLSLIGDAVLLMLGPIGRLIVALEYMYKLYQDIAYSFDENPLTVGNLSEFGDVKGNTFDKVSNFMGSDTGVVFDLPQFLLDVTGGKEAWMRGIGMGSQQSQLAPQTNVTTGPVTIVADNPEDLMSGFKALGDVSAQYPN